MYCDVLVRFLKNQRGTLPNTGYHPDIVIDGREDYWGITFIALNTEKFETVYSAKIQFTFQESHYSEIFENQDFLIKEGPKTVGTGTFIQIHRE